VDEGKTFADSSSILVWLAGKYGENQQPGPSTYWSTDLAEQAAIINWLAFANSWIQYGVFTARAILSFGGPYNGLGTASTEQTLKEAIVRSHKSLDILDQHLDSNEWLANGRPTIADLSVFVYVALAPMGDIDLSPYKNIVGWIRRVRALPGFIPIEGLDDPLYRRR
jgi:glutathione S-transferase